MHLFEEKERERIAVMVSPEEKGEGELLSVLTRKSGRPLKFPSMQDSNEPV